MHYSVRSAINEAQSMIRDGYTRSYAIDYACVYLDENMRKEVELRID